jgi:hypothetical protein
VVAWREREQIILRSLQPPGSPRVLGAGSRPVVAVHGDVAYVTWTYTEGLSSELRFTSVSLR